MYKLKIGKYDLRYTPLKIEVKEYPYCNEKGKCLQKINEGKRISYFVDDEGKKYDKAFRLVNDKPMAKLDKTKEVEIFKEVEEKEVNDLLTEKEYLVECDFLYEELKNSGKCLKFGFTNGNGFKTYYAYVYIDKLYNMLFMKLGRGLKSEIIQNIKEVMKNQQKAKDIQLKVSGVDKAKIEDLIKI